MSHCRQPRPALPELTNAASGEALTIYPNPFNNSFQINYAGNEVGHGKILVYSSDLKLIAIYPFEKTSRSMNQKIITNGLKNGLYIVEFQIGQTRIMRRQLRLM